MRGRDTVINIKCVVLSIKVLELYARAVHACVRYIYKQLLNVLKFQLIHLDFACPYLTQNRKQKERVANTLRYKKNKKILLTNNQEKRVFHFDNSFPKVKYGKEKIPIAIKIKHGK